MHEDDIIDEEMQIADERATTLGSAILTQPISDLKLRLPVLVRRDLSTREAVRRMVRGRVGCVLIHEDDRLIGIFTERDVLTKVVGKGIDADKTPVGDVMTPDPEALSPDMGISYALNRMSIGGFRHVPLVDEKGRPVGVVAMRNIVDYIVDLFPHDILNLPPEPGMNISRTREGA
jgi:CBS domain-containing protein